MKLFAVCFMTVVLCGCLAGAAFGHISTSHCAWTIEEGRQGRARCGFSTGPGCPNVMYSRGMLEGLAFGGIGPEDRLLLTAGFLQDNLVLLLRPDGSTDLRLPLPYTDPNWSGFCGRATDDDHIYLCNSNSGTRDDVLSCRRLDGSEVWNTTVRASIVVPVHHRGLAVLADWRTEDQGLMKVFDEHGNLVSEDVLKHCPYIAAFNADGIATWAYYTWEAVPGGGFEAEWFCASELNPDGVSIHSAYFPSYETYPAWGGYYTKVNQLGNVFVAAKKKVAVFADASLEAKLWEYTPDGFTVWENACGDPFGGWYVVHALPESDNDWFRELKLLRIDPDGTPAWDKSMGRPWITMGTHSVCKCDAAGNVYYAFQGEVISLDPDGTERWRMTFPEDDMDVLALDSSGTVYVRGHTDRTSIFDQTTLLALSDHKPHHSRVRVKMPEREAGDVYQPGEEVIVLLQPYNFGEDEVVDGYLAVILPNGAISYYTSSGFRASPTPWFPNVYLPNSYEMIDAPLFLGAIPEGAPEGTYTIIAGFTTPGTLTPVDELFPLTFQVVGR